MIDRKKVFSTIESVLERHGATALDTPDFELRETLRGKYGEDDKLIYDLADQGGELYSLRYDLTVPFARYVAMNKLTSFRRYQIAKVHRRFREFYQCDFDIAGLSTRMGPDFEVVKILTELLDELQIGDYEVEEKGLSLETAKKIGTYVTQRGPPRKLLEKLRKEASLLADKSSKEALEDLSILFEALEDLSILFEALEGSNCINRIVFDLSLARGLDYYTGVIFEAVCKGAEEIIRSTGTQVLVSVIADNKLAEAAKLASPLWAANIKTEFLVSKRRTKHFDYARKCGIPWMVIVDKTGLVTLKKIVEGGEEEYKDVPIDSFDNRLLQLFELAE
ncbi:unnamed protein product [Arabis nemorensis]|uniref:histidine--tRNA ligase n=1 Tax=Arabis nemorensis TaxID=586526 RepID=A0A565BY35_9BRAS|nr:unnamed protein product [Arabis nemorensis]